jgi:PAS domain S-box-containing protein
MITIPMLIEGRVVGVLGIDRFIDEERFTDEDFRIAKDFADQAALAMAKARLFEEIQQKHQAFQESEERYRRLVESISDIVVSADLQSRVIYVNPAIEQLTGYAPAEMIGRPFMEFVHPEDVDGLWQLVTRRLQGDTRIAEFRVVAKSGEVRYIQSTGQPVTEAGTVVAMTGILRDVTEQRRADARLASIYDVATRYQGQELFNQAARTLAELLGTQYALIGEIDGERRAVRSLAFYKQGQLEHTLRYDLSSTPCEHTIQERRVCAYPRHVQQAFPHDQGLRRWQIEAYIGAPIFGSQGEVVGVVNAFDPHPKEFTETEARLLQIVGQRAGAELIRQRQQEAHDRLQEQLLQAQKMEAIGLLAGGIAHDFNNLLGGVLGYASFIKQLIKDSDAIHPYINTIEMSARRAAELTQQLLGFARGGKYLAKPVSVNSVVGQTVKLLEGSLDKSIQVRQWTEPDLWLVEADAGQIQQALLNICINARDAMPGGGWLTIETHNVVWDEKSPALYPSAKPGPYVLLSITDTGIGMDRETQRKIFEPFFTTKERDKGTGLGLAMVYGIVKNHGGYITVDSEVGEGATFKIYLPALPGAAHEAVAVEAPTIARGVELILVVDDEEMIRDLTQDMLRMLGYQVVLAENGERAIEIYRERAEEIALVLVDMIMPKMGGQETYRRLKEVNPNVKAILSTGYSQAGKAQEILSQGVHGFIQKPYAIDELADAIRKALDSPS